MRIYLSAFTQEVISQSHPQPCVQSIRNAEKVHVDGV